MIADGDAMGIAAQIAKHGCGTRHRLFDIDDPVFPTAEIEEERGMLWDLSAARLRRRRLSLFLRYARFSPSRNLPRKTFFRTPSGRKKRYRGCTQWLRSGERPPTGTRQWICGWRSRFCPQVCKMARNPISAPRCLWIGRYFQQRFCHATKQQVVQQRRDCADIACSTREAG